MQYYWASARAAGRQACGTSGRWVCAAVAALVVAIGSGETAARDFFAPLDPPRRVQVIVSRGAAMVAPENTAPALEHCIADGLEWASVDLRVSADGQHVLFHDELLDDKTDGRGPLVERSLAGLKTLDAGKWFAPRFAGTRLLTLAEALRLAKGRLNLRLDCQSVEPRMLVHDIDAARVHSQVVVFGPQQLLDQVRRLSEGRIAIMGRWSPGPEDDPEAIARWLAPRGLDMVEIDAGLATRARLEAFHSRGVRVAARLAEDENRPEVWDRLLAAGVDLVQTDVPEEWLAHSVGQQLAERPVRWALHRGASRYAPENTLPAFEKAIRMGADLVEFDVQVTADGQYVLLHDRLLDRTTSHRGSVATMPYVALGGVDAGAWFGPAFRATRIPLLDEALARLHGRIECYIDAKAIPPEALAEVLVRHGAVEKSIVYQGPAYARALRERLPEIRTLLPLVDPMRVAEFIEREQPYAVDVRWEQLSAELIARCHELGVKVFSDAGDAQTPADYQAAIGWGIDLIQTDHPLRLLRAFELSEAGAASPPAEGAEGAGTPSSR